jgi:hypothetical protein
VFLYGLSPASAAAANSVYTTYGWPAQTSLPWATCGSISGKEGCYQSGSLGPFGHVCALLSDPPIATATGDMQRVYVVDSDGNLFSSNEVVLTIYNKVDTVFSSNVVTTFNAAGSFLIGAGGGTSTHCLAAANTKFLAIASSASGIPLLFNKTTFAIKTAGNGFPPLPVSAITANAQGYITINFAASGYTGGYYVVSPAGKTVLTGYNGNASVSPSANALTQ